MSLLNGKYKKNYCWSIETASGTHEVKAKMGETSRDTILIYLDNEIIERIRYRGKALIPKLEYNFSCDEDILTIVLVGSKMDLAHRGILVHHKIKYVPGEKLTKPFMIMVLALVVLQV